MRLATHLLFIWSLPTSVQFCLKQLNVLMLVNWVIKPATENFLNCSITPQKFPFQELVKQSVRLEAFQLLESEDWIILIRVWLQSVCVGVHIYTTRQQHFHNMLFREVLLLNLTSLCLMAWKNLCKWFAFACRQGRALKFSSSCHRVLAEGLREGHSAIVYAAQWCESRLLLKWS